MTIINENILDLGFKISDYITYGKNEQSTYQYFDLSSNKNGLDFKIKHDSKIYNIKSPMLGEYMAENITACFALANQIGIEPEKIKKSISKFNGIKSIFV